MGEAQTAKTGVHEVAHAKLHAKEVEQETGIAKDRETKEVEARASPTPSASTSGLTRLIILLGISPGGAAGRKCRS